MHPWLAVVQRRSLLTVACVVCKQGTWGTGTRGIEDLRLSQCQRHSESWGHMKALQAHTPSQTPADVAGAPGADLFHKLLDKPESATVAHGGVHCERKKCAQLRFCLAEAKRQRVRAFLRKSVFITLEQDVAQKRLVVLLLLPRSACMACKGQWGCLSTWWAVSEGPRTYWKPPASSWALFARHSTVHRAFHSASASG